MGRDRFRALPRQGLSELESPFKRVRLSVSIPKRFLFAVL